MRSELWYKVNRADGEDVVRIGLFTFEVGEKIVNRLLAESELVYSKYGVYYAPKTKWSKTVIRGLKAMAEAKGC